MWRRKKTKIEQNSSGDCFGSMISVLVFPFRGVALSLYFIWQKNGRDWLQETQREWEAVKDHWRQEMQCWWKKEVRAKWEAVTSDRVRRVKDKEYRAMTSSVIPLKLLLWLCLPTPSSGGILTGKCLSFPSAHINTDWWWGGRWLHGNYVTEWWHVK